MRDANFEDAMASEAPAQAIALHVLALTLADGLSAAAPVREFLRDFATSRDLDPERFDVAEFLDEVWPDGPTTTFYAANVGNDPSAPSYRLDLLLRPACEGPMGHRNAVGGLTLGLQVYRGGGKLNVKRVEVTPHVRLRHFERRVSAPVQRRDPDIYMEEGDFDSLAGLPYHRAITRDRLADWRGYLDWKENLIHANQLSMPYVAWRWETDAVLGVLVRNDDLPNRSLVGTELGALPSSARGDEGSGAGSDKRRQQRYRRDPELVEIGDVEKVYRPDLHGTRDRELWGEVELAPEHVCICIRVDEDRAEALRKRGLPREGRLLSSIAGDLGTLRKQKAGVDRLNNNQGFSPRLADFIFDSTNASGPLSMPELVPIIGARELNHGQREAVAKALAAPDLCLIQGPPGTGKTTVIADICLRATREGKRVLVASQANLAVDNALARLAEVPWVRPLRLGDPDRVDEEFRDFLAENVIDRWFATIAGHCRERMLSVEQDERDLMTRERAAERMRVVVTEHMAAIESLNRARDELAAARHAAEVRMAERDAARQRRDTHQRRAERLGALERWASEQAPLPPDAGLEEWPSGIALPSGLGTGLPLFAVLDRARQRIRPLRAIASALEMAMTGPAPDLATAQELHRLREEKSALVDSEADEDMRRLRLLNRQIRELEGGGWDRLTGELGRVARDAWPAAVPDAISVVVDALGRSATTEAALVQARALVQAEIAAGERVAEVVSASAAMWRTRLDETRRQLEAAQQAADRAVEAAADAEGGVSSATARELQASEAVRGARERWDIAARQVRPDAEPSPPSPAAVAATARAVKAARAAYGDRFARAARWRSVQQEWLDRLGRVTDSDREHLQALYVRYSNVVGMTCNEAGKRQTWQDPAFQPFDIVIVDEVSKATPPELLMPLLLGEKAVLVGDHRQLPPMFRERDASFGEAAEEGDVTKEDFVRFRRMVTASLFEELFEQAPSEIKAMLWTQYRMHPRIMDAVNEFYEHRLEPGPDREQLCNGRRHNLTVHTKGGERLITPDRQLIWIDSSAGPNGKPAWEEQRGMSKLNRLEIEVVTASLVLLGRALVSRGYGPTTTVSVDQGDAGRTWEDVLRSAMPHVPDDTVADLFGERCVRVNGRAQKRDGAARAGATIHVRAKKEVGVITFYGAQLRELRRSIDRARSKHPDVFSAMELRTNTVDRFQGMEKPIVFVSLVRSKRGRLGEFVREFQRINVGLSRAQQLLVIVGAEETWKHADVSLPPLDGGDRIDVPVYRNILELVRQGGGRRLAREVL